MRRLAMPLIALALVVAAGLIVFWPRPDALLGEPIRPGSSTDTSPSASGEPSASDPPAWVTRPPRPALRRFYAQRLSWRPCHDGHECAALTVPLDYRRPAGRTIALALLRVPAGDPGDRIGSLLVNPGGPGAPGTELAARQPSRFGEALLDRFDVVGFDPRGTGSSAPVDCLTDDELDRFVAADPDPDTRPEVAAVRSWATRIGAGCARRSRGVDAHVSTVEAVRDIDVLRAALGDRRLHFLGFSYGTVLGATYAELFPDRAGRLVLDGAVDLTLGSREQTRQQAAGFETALRAYVGNCVDSADACFLGDTVDEGVARIRDFLDRVDLSPLATQEPGRRLAVGNAYYGVAAPLYEREAWPVLSLALRSGFAGDGTVLLRISDLYTSRGPDGYTDNSTEANYAINCLDDPSSIPASRVPAQYAAFDAASPTFGRTFAWGLTACSGFTRTATERIGAVDGAGAPPILVVGTTRDPATPLAWAEAMAEQLDSAVLVRRDGDGHLGYGVGNACVDDAVESYLIDGTVPEDGLNC